MTSEVSRWRTGPPHWAGAQATSRLTSRTPGAWRGSSSASSSALRSCEEVSAVEYGSSTYDREHYWRWNFESIRYVYAMSSFWKFKRIISVLTFRSIHNWLTIPISISSRILSNDTFAHYAYFHSYSYDLFMKVTNNLDLLLHLSAVLYSVKLFIGHLSSRGGRRLYK